MSNSNINRFITVIITVISNIIIYQKKTVILIVIVITIFKKHHYYYYFMYCFIRFIEKSYLIDKKLVSINHNKSTL